MTLPSTLTDPVVTVYELPGRATFTAFTADLPGAGSNDRKATVDFAVASDGPNGSFRDVGTLTGEANEGVKILTAPASGRWVRVTSAGAGFDGVAALGTLAPRPANAPQPSGIFVEDASPYLNGTYLGHSTDKDPWYRRIGTLDTAMSGARCYAGRLGAGYPGAFDGRTWTYADNANAGRAIFNDEGTTAIGDDAGQPMYLMRVDTQPKYCMPQTSGRGSHRVLVLDSGPQTLWPIEDDALPGYRYTRIHASMLDRNALATADIAIANMLCNASSYFAKGQTDALLDWIGRGHKLLIVDSDECPSSRYAFLPYPFVTSNPGATGASGSRLIIVESDALGATEASDAHFVDPKTYINNGGNQLGDANIVTTQDPHWCGHLFGTNVKHDNGFMQMYAPYGQGMIIYDGFDHDDGSNPGYRRVRTLELQLAVPAGMPCTQRVAGSFVVQPSAEATFKTGASRRLSFPMETLASLGWNGHVTVSTAGPFGANVTPSSFQLAGTTQPMKVTVDVPASAKAGVYTISVTGTDGRSHLAQATITLTAIAPIVKHIKKHQRVRVYGIHFDVDSAHLQPQSEKVVREIADLMKANPQVRFQVEGHTDSDGGAAYNRGLSQRRAQAVVDDLASRYRIARSRMTPKGFGLTRPVAPNTTPANKALNRRVELLAL
jgi:outer membrane protein OmpA-like peptidoglycan-associated protein